MAFLEYLPQVPEYRVRRQRAGSGAETSALSPYLRTRLLDEHEVAAQVRRLHGSQGGAFLEQLGWRVYFKGHLEQHPRCWEDWKQRVGACRCGLRPETADLLARAEAGETGLEGFDAWSRQLRETAWLPNRLRLWHAGIWVHTLRLPWELGAAFYLRHLMDGDPAANTLSWRWVAGLHTPGKVYLPQAEIIRQASGGLWDLRGRLATEAAMNHFENPARAESVLLETLPDAQDARQPGLSLAPAGLLVTPEDLLPEQGALSQGAFASVAVLGARDVWDSHQLAEPVRDWLQRVLLDTARRAGRHWDAEVVAADSTGTLPLECPGPAAFMSLCSRPRVHVGVVDHWCRGVLAWARREHLRCIRLYRPPVGPWRDQMPRLRSMLQREGIALIEHRRTRDAAHWPHAARGFFSFREHWLAATAGVVSPATGDCVAPGGLSESALEDAALQSQR